MLLLFYLRPKQWVISKVLLRLQFPSFVKGVVSMPLKNPGVEIWFGFFKGLLIFPTALCCSKEWKKEERREERKVNMTEIPNVIGQPQGALLYSYIDEWRRKAPLTKFGKESVGVLYLGAVCSKFLSPQIGVAWHTKLSPHQYQLEHFLRVKVLSSLSIEDPPLHIALIDGFYLVLWQHFSQFPTHN